MTFKFSIRMILAVAFAICFSATSQAQTIAYTNATIETMTKEGQLKDATIVIRDDKIVEVGTDVDVPGDAKIISMDGKTIMPGMIDPYFVYSTSGASSGTRTVVFNGRTFTVPNRTTFSVGGFTNVGDYFYPYKFNFKPAIRSGITVGNFVSDGRGLSAYVNVSEDKSPEMIFKKDGYLFAKITNSTSALDVLRKPLGTDEKKTTATKTSTRTTSRTTTSSSRPKSDAQKSADKVKELWKAVKEGKSPLFVNVNNAASVAYVLQIMEKHEKVKLNLVSTGSNVYQLIDDIESNENVTVILQPAIETIPYSTNFMNVSQMLADKEIPFAFSMSLSGSQLRSSQDDPMFPLAMLVRSGLDRKTALKSVTLKPAELMGIEKTHGSLEKDKKANLLVFDGDPLQTGTRLHKVILNGKTIHEN